MPFTFSHPAIILPLTLLPRNWVSGTGLIIGSLTPDFEYFMRMKIESQYSHSIAGLFWFDLPLGILLAFLFHNLIRNSLFVNLPFILQSRLSRYLKFDWNKYFKKHWPVIVISTLIGAASHILWDSFTHENGYFMQTSSILKGNFHLFGEIISKFKLMQHSSTLIGAILIVISIYKLPTTTITKYPISLKYWMITLFIATGTVVIRSFMMTSTTQLGNLIFTVISGTMIGMVAASIIFNPRTARSS